MQHAREIVQRKGVLGSSTVVHRSTCLHHAVHHHLLQECSYNANKGANVEQVISMQQDVYSQLVPTDAGSVFPVYNASLHHTPNTGLCVV